MAERIISGPRPLTAREIFQACKNLPKNTFHQGLYYMVTPDNGGFRPCEVIIGKDSKSELVFIFRNDSEDRFEAVAFTARDNPDVPDVHGAYTYVQLLKMIKELAGERAVFMPATRDTIPAGRVISTEGGQGAPQTQGPPPISVPEQSNWDRMSAQQKREVIRRDNVRHFSSLIQAAQREHGFDNQSHRRLFKAWVSSRRSRLWKVEHHVPFEETRHLNFA
jgi:hypothetical protein